MLVMEEAVAVQAKPEKKFATQLVMDQHGRQRQRSSGRELGHRVHDAPNLHRATECRQMMNSNHASSMQRRLPIHAIDMGSKIHAAAET